MPTIHGTEPRGRTPPCAGLQVWRTSSTGVRRQRPDCRGSKVDTSCMAETAGGPIQAGVGRGDIVMATREPFGVPVEYAAELRAGNGYQAWCQALQVAEEKCARGDFAPGTRTAPPNAAIIAACSASSATRAAVTNRARPAMLAAPAQSGVAHDPSRSYLGLTHTRLAIFPLAGARGRSAALNFRKCRPPGLRRAPPGDRFRTRHPGLARSLTAPAVAGPVLDGRRHATNLPRQSLDTPRNRRRPRPGSRWRRCAAQRCGGGRARLAVVPAERFAMLQRGAPGARGNQALDRSGNRTRRGDPYWDGTRATTPSLCRRTLRFRAAR